MAPGYIRKETENDAAEEGNEERNTVELPNLSTAQTHAFVINADERQKGSRATPEYKKRHPHADSGTSACINKCLYPRNYVTNPHG